MFDRAPNKPLVLLKNTRKIIQVLNPTMKNTAYWKKKIESPREDPRTQGREEDPTTEDLAEDPITEEPKVDPIAEDPRGYYH